MFSSSIASFTDDVFTTERMFWVRVLKLAVRAKKGEKEMEAVRSCPARLDCSRTVLLHERNQSVFVIDGRGWDSGAQNAEHILGKLGFCAIFFGRAWHEPTDELYDQLRNVTC